MRDAFGGVFMTNLFLVFIVIYVAFTAVSLNYAKAFRIKNQIIDYIEENEITELTSAKIETSKLKKILSDANYNQTCNDEGPIVSSDGKTIGYCYSGIVILKESEETISGTKSKIIKYNVSTYADWDLGTLNKILALGNRSENSEEYVTGTWAITGEATVVAKK